MDQRDISTRKTDHIELAFESQVVKSDPRFNYEPFLKAHPEKGSIPPVHFSGKILKAPLWISSMTGGADHAEKINRILASVCREFGLGMGLGSCRPLLENDRFYRDFEIRKYIGEQPLYANLGIAQIEQMLKKGEIKKVNQMISRLDADGLIVHVNPLQEWLQPEGDLITRAPIETIEDLLSQADYPLIVKEVGQGFGPQSMLRLVQLPLEAIDFGASGGTNFSMLENLRRSDNLFEAWEPVAQIGHAAEEMCESAALLIENPEINILARGFIVSGGIRNFLDGYYSIRKIPYKSIYAQASAFLKYALEGEMQAMKYAESQIRGLELAYNYLTLKK